MQKMVNIYVRTYGTAHIKLDYRMWVPWEYTRKFSKMTYKLDVTTQTYLKDATTQTCLKELMTRNAHGSLHYMSNYSSKVLS